MERGLIYRSYRGKRPYRAFIIVILIAVVIGGGFFTVYKYRDQISFSKFADWIKTAYIKEPSDSPPKSEPETKPQPDAPSSPEPPQNPTPSDQTPGVSDEEPLTAKNMANSGGVVIPVEALISPERLEKYIGLAKIGAAEALVIDFKGDSGLLAYPCEHPGAQSAGCIPENLPVLSEIIASIKEAGVPVFARISCFRDDKFARFNRNLCVKTTGGSLWYDRFMSAWIDPAEQGGREYVQSVIFDALNYDFDGIMLDNIAFPSMGKVNLLGYSEQNSSQRTSALLEFLNSAFDYLKKKDMPFVCITEWSTLAGDVNYSGQTTELFSKFEQSGAALYVLSGGKFGYINSGKYTPLPDIEAVKTVLSDLKKETVPPVLLLKCYDSIASKTATDTVRGDLSDAGIRYYLLSPEGKDIF